MKTHSLFLLLFCFHLNFFCQQKTPSIQLYDLGNIAYAAKDYRKADSLFTLSLKLEPYPDTYFNRAVCRKKLNDIKGYCLDMKGASKMFDKEAEKLYQKDCVKIDTILTKDGDRPARLNDFEIAEFYTSYAYKSSIEYEKYNKNSNLILSYELNNLDTIYTWSEKTSDPEFQGGNTALIKYLTENIYSIKTLKKVPFWGQKCIVITTNADGKVINAESEIKDTEIQISPGVLDSMSVLLMNGPNWKPAKLNGRSVSFKKPIYFYSYGNTIKVEELVPYKRFIGEVFTQVDEMPEFPGGAMEMMKFIQANIVYPQSAKKANISGKCWLKFTITAEGRIGSIELLRGVAGCHECDVEAIRVVMSMPRWKPGKQNGNPVAVFFNLPINFTLK